jgi:hypothetical protein
MCLRLLGLQGFKYPNTRTSLWESGTAQSSACGYRCGLVGLVRYHRSRRRNGENRIRYRLVQFMNNDVKILQTIILVHLNMRLKWWKCATYASMQMRAWPSKPHRSELDRDLKIVPLRMNYIIKKRPTPVYFLYLPESLDTSFNCSVTTYESCALPRRRKVSYNTGPWISVSMSGCDRYKS